MKTSIFIFLFGILAMHAFSQNGKQPSKYDTDTVFKALRLLKEIRVSINKIDDIVDVPNDTIRDKNGWKIHTESEIIRKKIDTLSKCHIGSYTDTLINIYIALSNRFIKYAEIGSKARYEPQISAFQDYIDTYREKTLNLHQYIESLIPDLTVINLVKYVRIEDSLQYLSTLKQIDILADCVSLIDRSVTDLNTKTDKIISKAKKIDSTTSDIKKMLAPLSSPKIIVSTSGYSDNVFGATFLYTLPKTTDTGYKPETNISQHIGAQFVFPVNSSVAKDPGGFVMYGLRDRKLLLQAGIGYFNSGKTQNISWIGGALYFPQKLGIGLSYSPLTSVGLQLAFRF